MYNNRRMYETFDRKIGEKLFYVQGQQKKEIREIRVFERREIRAFNEYIRIFQCVNVDTKQNIM